MVDGWLGVRDPATLRAQIGDWLGQYANPGTRRAYAYALGLPEVADRVHPLRHAYVTIALEQDARIQHVQADVGHATIATTQHYDRGRRTRDATAADLVAAAILAAPDRSQASSTGSVSRTR